MKVSLVRTLEIEQNVKVCLHGIKCTPLGKVVCSQCLLYKEGRVKSWGVGRSLIERRA